MIFLLNLEFLFIYWSHSNAQHFKSRVKRNDVKQMDTFPSLRFANLGQLAKKIIFAYKMKGRLTTGQLEPIVVVSRWRPVIRN